MRHIVFLLVVFNIFSFGQNTENNDYRIDSKNQKEKNITTTNKETNIIPNWNYLIKIDTNFKNKWDNLDSNNFISSHIGDLMNFSSQQDELVKHGLSPDEAKNWIIKYGKSSYNSINLYTQGIKDQNEVNKWIFIFQYLREYSTVDLNRLLQLNFTPEKILYWYLNGVYEPQNVYDLELINVKTTDEYNKWMNLRSISYISSIKNFKKSNISLEEATAWDKIPIINSIIDINLLKKFNIDQNETISWIKAGIKTTREIIDLKKIGIQSPEEFIKWKETKLVIPDQVQYLTNINVSPEFFNQNPIIMSMLSTNIKQVFFSSKENLNNYIKILNENNCKKFEQDYFDTVDEYDNEDKCYFFVGVMAKRMDKNNGYMAIKRNIYSYVNFDGSWPESQAANGIIKGLGSYTVKDSTGESKIIRNGKVLILNVLHGTFQR